MKGNILKYLFAAVFVFSFARISVARIDDQYTRLDSSNIAGGPLSTAAGGTGLSTAGQSQPIVTLTDGATVTPDFSLGNYFKISIGGNRTLANPTNLVQGSGQSFQIKITQDATGSRTLAYDWGYNFPGGVLPVLSTTPLSRDILYGDVTLYRQGTVTISIGTPGVVTFTGHGIINSGVPVRLTTTGALPTGLSTGTTYYTIYVDENTFRLATSVANAAAGTAIATSGTQSGVHTLTALAIDCAMNNASRR